MTGRESSLWHFVSKSGDYYLVMNEDYGAAFTIADNGYVGLVSVSLLQFKEKWGAHGNYIEALSDGKIQDAAVFRQRRRDLPG